MYNLVLDTKVKLGLVEFKAFFFHTESWFSWTSLANPSCFYAFSILVSLPFARHTQHVFILDLIAFHSSGVSLLTGQ